MRATWKLVAKTGDSRLDYTLAKWWLFLLHSHFGLLFRLLQHYAPLCPVQATLRFHCWPAKRNGFALCCAVSFFVAYAFNGFWSGWRKRTVRDVVVVSFGIDIQKNCSLLGARTTTTTELEAGAAAAVANVLVAAKDSPPAKLMKPIN